MNAEEQEVKRIIDKHQNDLKSISNEIVKGTLLGIKEGIAEGLKSGIKSGLNYCFTKGLINIGQDDIQDFLVLKDIAEGTTIKDRVKKEAKNIFVKFTEEYLKKVCRRFIDRIKKSGVKLSEVQMEGFLDLMTESQTNALKKAEEKLPNNFLINMVMAGMRDVWQDTLAELYIEYENKMRQEII